MPQHAARPKNQRDIAHRTHGKICTRREKWPTMTSNVYDDVELERDQRTIYLGRMLFSSKVIVRDTQTHRHEPDGLIYLDY